MTETNNAAKAATPKPNVNSGPAPTKPENKSGSKKWLIGCVVVLVVLILCCVISFCVASMAGPSQLAGMFVSDQPLDIEQPRQLEQFEIEALQSELSTQMSNGERVSLNPDTVVQLLFPPNENDQNQILVIDINEQDLIEFDLSFEESPGQYINVQAVVDAEIQNSMFSKFVIDELTVGSFNLGMFLQGQDLAVSVNQDLQTDGNSFDGVKYFGAENGEFVIELDPSFFDQTGLDTTLPEGLPTGFEMPAEIGQ